MTGNTSATGGPLLPDGVITPPTEDDALDDFFGDLVAGLTGLDRDNYVRPRWQPDPPPMPDFGTDWAAVGATLRPADTYSYQHFDGTAANGDGAMLEIRHETLDILVSFYGPNAGGNAALMRDGLGIAQNREPLFQAGMGFVEVGQAIKAPELIKNRWVPRWDVTLTVRREVRREYAIVTIESVQAQVVANTSGGQIAVETQPVSRGAILDGADPDESINLTRL